MVNSVRYTLLSGIAIAFISGSAYAQQGQADKAVASVGSSEIVVTARKREERLRDVPETVVVLNSEAMKLGGVSDFNALGRQTPGIVMNRRQNNGSPNVVIRGVGSFGNVQGVGFYIDDVQNFTDQTMRLKDVERVEILKGPQGTLFGGSSLGGAVRYISKMPSFDPQGEVQVEKGTHGYRDLYAAASLPLIDDTLALRISGSFTHDDGFTTNIANGMPTSPLNESSIRGQLLYLPNEQFEALLTLRTHQTEGGAYAYALHDSVADPSSETDASFAPLQDTRVWAATLNLNYDLGGADLTSITSYTHAQTKLQVDADYGTVPTLVVYGPDTRPVKVMTQELRVTSSGDDWLSWILGATAARYENHQLNPSPLLLNFNGFDIPDYFDYYNRETVLAAFGSLDWKFGDLTLTTGMRLNRTDYDSSVYHYAGVPTDERKSVKDTALLPKMSLSYKTMGNTNLYASASRGYESGKVDPTVTPSNPYVAETAWYYEIGVKGSAFSSALYFEAAAFYIDDKERQYTDYVIDGRGLLTKTVHNIGTARTKGAELSLILRPTDKLTLTGSTSYVNSHWKSDAIYAGGSVEGRQVPNAPEWTANMGATYITELVNGFSLNLHADASFMDSFPWTLDYVPISNDNPSYWIVTGRIGLTSPDDRWEIALRGENLLNTDYYTEFHPQYFGLQDADGTCDHCHLGVKGAGRRFIGSIGMKF